MNMVILEAKSFHAHLYPHVTEKSPPMTGELPRAYSISIRSVLSLGI
jgi:hypothetical protein